MDQLIAFLKEQNLKTQAWVAEDPTNRWAGLHSEDPQNWIDRGITTIEQYERDSLETFVYEATKDVYHYRPSMQSLNAMSIEELEAEAKTLSIASEREAEREREIEARMFKVFEERIADIQELMNNSKEDALRILTDAEGLSEDVQFYGYDALEYRLKLAYGAIKKWLES